MSDTCRVTSLIAKAMFCVRLTLGNVKTLLVTEILVAEILVDAVLWAWRFWIDVAETIGSDKTHGWKEADVR